MRTNGFKNTAMLWLALAAALPCVAAAAGMNDAAKALSREMLDYAGANGRPRIAVLEFSAMGAEANSEAHAVAEQLGGYLSGRGKTAGIDKIALESALARAEFTSSGVSAAARGRKLQDAFAADAIVTGTVFAVGGNIEVVARLRDPGTGRVLLKARAGWRTEGAAASMELPGFPGPYPWAQTDEAPVPPGDLRDAVAEYRDSSCSAKKKRIAELNLNLVDAKARYWADKISRPEFLSGSLRLNPGIEISDQGVKAVFYRLLGIYRAGGEAALTDPDKLAAVLELIGTEARFFTECEFY